MDLLEKYYTLALRYLQIRQRSEKEIRDYLKKKKASGESIDQIVLRLKHHKFLDDELFAKLWVESRTRTKPRSKWLLQRELKEKGVSQSIIKAGLASMTEAKSDLILAKEAIERRIARVHNLPKNEIYQKVGGFLARRGFNWEISKRAIDDLLKEGYNSDE